MGTSSSCCAIADRLSSSQPPISAPTNQFKIILENDADSYYEEVPIQNLGPNWPFYNVIFVGVTSPDPFDRISFSETYDYDGLLYDDLIAGYVDESFLRGVPEPASTALAAMALVAFVGRSRRR